MTSTASRLLDLLSLLQSRRDWPGGLLADRLGISRRTVRRDVDRLRGMGYRIRATMGPDGGYRLDAGSELPPLLFDDDQVVALAVALRAASATGAGVGEAALRALTTVRQVMPSRLRHRLDALEFTAIAGRPGDATSGSVSPDVLVAVSSAIRSRSVLRFDYASVGSAGAGRSGDAPERGAPGAGPEDRAPDAGAEPGPPRRVEPHHLVAAHGRWYLIAWDLDRDDWRIFRADRISPRTPAGARFAPRQVPGGDASAYLSARFRGSEQGDAWPCTGRVVVHRPARDVLPFAGDGGVEDLGPDRCILEAGSWSWLALAASICRLDAEIDVLGPPELVDAFALLASRSAATVARGVPGGSEPSR